jgi:hypothetical protein
MKWLKTWFHAAGTLMDIGKKKKNYNSVFSYLAEKFLMLYFRWNDTHIKYKQQTTFVGLHLCEIWNWVLNVNNLSSRVTKIYCVMQSFEGITCLNILSNV